MRIDVLSAALQSVYSNGRVKSAKKLDREDFLQITKAATGTFMRQVYYEESNIGSIFGYFGNILRDKEFTVKKDKNHRYIIDLEDSPFVKLPHGMGVYGVSDIDEEGYVQEDTPYTRQIPGSDQFYSNADLDDLGEQTFQLRANAIVLRKPEGEPNKVMVQGIFLDDDIDVPEDIAFSIMNVIFTKIVPLQGFPVDKTDDGNPNLIEYKKRLTESEQL